MPKRKTHQNKPIKELLEELGYKDNIISREIVKQSYLKNNKTGSTGRTLSANKRSGAQ